MPNYVSKKKNIIKNNNRHIFCSHTKIAPICWRTSRSAPEITVFPQRPITYDVFVETFEIHKSISLKDLSKHGVLNVQNV